MDGPVFGHNEDVFGFQGAPCREIIGNLYGHGGKLMEEGKRKKEEKGKKRQDEAGKGNQ